MMPTKVCMRTVATVAVVAFVVCGSYHYFITTYLYSDTPVYGPSGISKASGISKETRPDASSDPPTGPKISTEFISGPNWWWLKTRNHLISPDSEVKPRDLVKEDDRHPFDDPPYSNAERPYVIVPPPPGSSQAMVKAWKRAVAKCEASSKCTYRI